MWARRGFQTAVAKVGASSITVHTSKTLILKYLQVGGQEQERGLLFYGQ